MIAEFRSIHLHAQSLRWTLVNGAFHLAAQEIERDCDPLVSERLQVGRLD
jgi:hypothetical protein